MNEIKRLYLIRQIIEGQMTGSQGAVLLGISLRQVRRLVAKYREVGTSGIAHGNRGKVPNNEIEKGIRSKVLELARGEYRDYNDCHFTEVLEEKYGLHVSRSTVRRIRHHANLKSPRKRRAPRHRSRRERKEQSGMLLQTDGSHHDWLEGRGPNLCLIAYIDDATNEVPGAAFREEEDAAGYFLVLEEICLKKGIPGAIYADQHTIFQSPSKATVEQELNGGLPKSQFGRLLDELGVELIAAKSPQAKGRIERLWGTLQDRLVKALREANAGTLGEANRVLADFLPKYNQRFQVKPNQAGNAYVPWPEEMGMKNYFCFKHTRTVANDNTIPFNGHRLQIAPGPKNSSYAKRKVDVRQHLDGSLEICYEGKRLAIFDPLDKQQPVRVNKFTPAPVKDVPRIQSQPKQPYPSKSPKSTKPAADHPWRKPFLPQKAEQL